jgi:hypothetical protein
MPTSFRRPFTVLVRNLGQWVEGVYQSSAGVGVERTIQATVQMPSTGDMNAIEVTPYGKRAGRYIKIYTDERLNCVNQRIGSGRDYLPGDIFYYDGSEYLIFGESDFQMLGRSRSTSVSHWRYYACELIESAALENAL